VTEFFCFSWKQIIEIQNWYCLSQRVNSKCISRRNNRNRIITTLITRWVRSSRWQVSICFGRKKTKRTRRVLVRFQRSIIKSVKRSRIRLPTGSWSIGTNYYTRRPLSSRTHHAVTHWRSPPFSIFENGHGSYFARSFYNNVNNFKAEM